MTDQYQPYDSAQPAPTVPSEPPQKIGKFKASRMIASASWNLLKKDKEMTLFPIASILLNIVFFALVCLTFFFVVLQGDMTMLEALGEEESTLNTGGLEYVFVFVLYVVSYFITTFFEAGIVAIAHGRINNQNLSFGDGVRAASARVCKLFLWSLLSATVGMVLRAIAERSKFIGKIVVWLLGAAWNILSYFIVPVLMVEKLSIPDSLKQSANTIKRSWGETAIVNVGVGLLFVVLAFAGAAVVAVLAFVAQTPVVIVPLVILYFIYVLVLVVISSTLSTIFKIVLYEYATKGTVPEGFQAELFQSAFATKKK